MQRNTVWMALEEPAIERLITTPKADVSWRGESDGGAFNLRGMIVGVLNGEPLHVSYNISVDTPWDARWFSVQALSHGGRVSMRSDELGNWTTEDARLIPELAGCLDIDISATPATNTLPIRRLRLAVGASAEIDVVYVQIPSLDISSRRQRYTRLADRKFRFESLDGGRTVFTADFDVDEDGLVIDYPGLFKRLYPEATAR